MPAPRESEDVTVVAKIPCAACGCEPKTSAKVWEQWLCYPCIAKWDADFPSDSEWYASHPEDSARFAAKKSLTAQWVQIQASRAA
jgi:hypothetical protein